MTSIGEKIRKYLERLEELFHRGERSGRVLALLAIVRLHDRGARITPDSVADEARRIIQEHPHIDWGISLEAVNTGLMSDILKELAREGVLEEVEGGYVIRKTELVDPAAEIVAKFGHLILYGGPAR